jgi:hypothetical protein
MLLGKLFLAVSVVVGLVDGNPVSIENPRFAGFIETRDNGEAVLLYRDKAVHGEMKVSLIQRIDFAYRRGQPFLLSITLKDGRKLDVESAGRDFVTVKGDTDTGAVEIKHPDPIATPLRLSETKPNRKNDLTIQYLEFPR